MEFKLKKEIEEYKEAIKFAKGNELFYLLVDKFKSGTSYTEEHLELFIKENKSLGNYFKLTPKNLNKFIKDMFKIEKKQVRNKNFEEYNFLYNIKPTKVSNKKKVTVYTIINLKTVDDIIKELGLNEEEAKEFDKKSNEKFERESYLLDKYFSIKL